MRDQECSRERPQKSGMIRTASTFTFGAFLGSIAALLLAPTSGRVARQRINKRVRSLEMKAASRIHKTTRKLSRRAVKLGKVTTRKIDHARDWVGEHLSNGNGHGKQIVRRHKARHA